MRPHSTLRDHGLVLVLLALFLGTWIGQWLTGWCGYNQDAREHGGVEVSAMAYLRTGDFWEATGENWESEFLQMGVFVILTALLFQKGSPESNDPDAAAEPPRAITPASPWPVRAGGWWAALYRYSLSIAFLLLFAASFALHALGGWCAQGRHAREHGQPAPALGEYVTSSQFWFESMQNWQSEFLSLVAMVWLSVYLRHAGSAESKAVAAAHTEHD